MGGEKGGRVDGLILVKNLVKFRSIDQAVMVVYHAC